MSRRDITTTVRVLITDPADTEKDHYECVRCGARFTTPKDVVPTRCPSCATPIVPKGA